MADLTGKSIGVLGALSALPMRLATKRVHELGGRLHRGQLRGTTILVLGRGLLTRYGGRELERRLEAGEHTPALLSESGLLRLIGSRPAPPAGTISRAALLRQSSLDPYTLDWLTLFDAFEHHEEPYSFRDLVMARKYAALVADGATWLAIARSIKPGSSGTLTPLHLEFGEDRIVSRDDRSVFELDGQRVMQFDAAAVDEEEDWFSRAEAAEAESQFEAAARLYGRCAAIDPNEATAAFNQGNCLRELRDLQAAMTAYATALKRDPLFSEAWLNQAAVLRDLGHSASARVHLLRAIGTDPEFGDAIYNLAALEYDEGELAEAARWWRRYLDLDQSSEWARRARAGVALAERQLRSSAG